MGFNNPAMTWSELHGKLTAGPAGPGASPRGSDGPAGPGASPRGSDGRPSNVPEHANGGDSPAWSRKRQPYEPSVRWQPGAVPYAELHCHSNFSFLDGASHPEELAREAARLGLEALALTDHDGFYGVVRFAEAAKAMALRTVFGAELSLGLTAPQNGVADPEGHHLLVLARHPGGYARLSRAISEAQLRTSAGGGQVVAEKGKPVYDVASKGKPVYDLDELAAAHDGGWLVLTGCRKGAVPATLVAEGPAAASRVLGDLVARFGRDNVAVELWDHGDPLDSARNDEMAKLAGAHRLAVVATNNVHYATPAQRPLATALAAVRARRSLDEIDGWLPAAVSAHLRSGAEQERRFRRYPGAIEMAAELGRACAFDLQLVAPSLPPFDCGAWGDEMTFLRHLVEEGGHHRYGTRAERPDAWRQLDHELALIEQLGFPGYFLIVWDIVRFCREADIYCQGRGSAANSAVCFALGITNADAVGLGLLFERFLSPERDGPPDIDLDIESDRREEAIQYVYEKHGRHHAAQVANVITYRGKSAIRDTAKALGFAPGQQDAWSKQADPWSSLRSTANLLDHDIPAPVLELAQLIEHFPRHLGIHSGGMVLCDRPVIEVCPVEWARMEDRSVLQWDKDDCAAVGLVKFDLLGLGMLSAIHGTVDLVREAHGDEIDLAALPQDDAIYDMLCRADSVGVFQVESRAQMSTLPRLKPRTFYDLVVEIALIRPGPIQGGSVHPYIRRRNGEEVVTYPHPLAEKALAKTLGVPLFQEQLMQLAIDIGGFTPAESDQLRMAMGSKRSRERMEQLHERFHQGASARGVDGPTIEVLWEKLAAFANYGFPESHSVSFAYLVYSSSWLKRWYPAAFCAGLLNAQPMGFYSPHSLVQDARRHGVEVRTPDLNASAAGASLETDRGASPPAAAGRDAPPETWGHGGPAVRLGIGSVRGIDDDLAGAIVAERAQHGPYASMEDLRRRVPALNLAHLEALATAGAFGECFGLQRRRALWQAGAVAQSTPGRLPGIVTGADAPALTDMLPREVAVADLWATGMSPEGHPTRFWRGHLDDLGVVTARGLVAVAAGERVLVAGVVTHRQRPATAQGTTFINLEDETGFTNVVVSRGCWTRYRRAAQGAPALLVRGRVERQETVINIIADRIEPMDLAVTTKSRDFR